MNCNNSPLEYLAAFAIAFVAGMVSAAAMSAMRHGQAKEKAGSA